MSIPNRSYTPGGLDSVFNRVVPTEPPVAEHYASGRDADPSVFIVDLVLYKRAQQSPSALAFDIESTLSSRPGELLDFELLEKTVEDFKPSEIPGAHDAIPFMLELMRGLMTWGNAAYGKEATLGGNAILDSAAEILANGDKHSDYLAREMEAFQAALDSGKTPAEAAALRKEDLRKRVRASMTPKPKRAAGGLLGRIVPGAKPGPVRTELTRDERHQLNETWEPYFVLIRAAVDKIYERTDAGIKEGLRVLDRIIEHSGTVCKLSAEVEQEVIAEHGYAEADAVRKSRYQEAILEQTKVLRVILDPSQVDDEQLIAIANAMNVGFIEDFRQVQIDGNRNRHGDHGDCHVKEFGFDLIRLPYRRVYSVDPSIDNTLAELPELAGVILDANDNTLTPYALAMHPALVKPAETALEYQLENGGVPVVQQIVGEWAPENLEFMRLFDLRSTNELVKELGDRLDGDIPRNAVGAALSITPGVFVPMPHQMQAVLKTVLYPMGEGELTTESLQEGGAE